MDKNPADPGTPTPQRTPYPASVWRLRFAFVLGSLLVVAAGRMTYDRYATATRRDAEGLLLSIATTRSVAIVDHMRERRADAFVLAGHAEVRQLLDPRRATAPRTTVEQAMRETMRSVAQAYNYHNIAILDRDLRPVLSLAPDYVGPEGRTVVRAVLADGIPRVIPVHRSTVGAVEYGVAVPIRASATDSLSRIIGGLYVVMDLSAQLFPMLGDVATANRTLDVVLAQLEGDSVALLRSSRSARDLRSADPKVALKDSTLIARVLASGKPLTFSGLDYGNDRVVGGGTTIPGTPWAVEAKVDQAEVEAGIRAVGYTATTIVALIILAMGVLTRTVLLQREKLATKAQRREAARTIHVIQTSIDGFVKLDPVDGRFLEVNDALCEIVGYSRPELLTMRLADVKIVKSASEVVAALTTSAAGGSRRLMSQWRHRDGRVVDIEVSNTTVRDETGAAQIYAFIRDITERLETSRRLERLNALYVFLNHANEALFQAHSQQEAFDTVTKSAVEGGFSLSWVGLVEPESGIIRPVSWFGSASSYVENLVLSVDPSVPGGTGPTARAIRSQQPVVVNDYLNDPITAPWHGLALTHGLRSTAVFPILVDDEPIGAIMFYAPEADFFQPDLTALLSEIARTLRLVLQSLHAAEERRLEADRRRASEARFRGLFDASPVAMYVVEESSGTLLYMNRPCVELFGYTMEDLPTLAVAMERFYPDPMYRAGLQEVFARNMHDITPEHRTARSPVLRVRCKDGSDRQVQGFVTRIGGDLVIAWVDLTELRANQEQLQEAQLIARMASWTYDFRTEKISRSEALVRMYGQEPSAETLAPTEFGSLFHHEDRERVRSEFLRGVWEHLPCEVTARAIMPDGTIRHFRNRAKVIYDEADRPLRAIGTTQDVTSEVEAAQELERYRMHLEELVSQRTSQVADAYAQVHASERRYAYAMEASSEGIWDWDLVTDRIEASASVYTMLGYEPNEFVITPAVIRDLRHPDDRRRVDETAIRLIAEQGGFTQEYRMRAKDSSYRWILSHGKVVERDASGAPVRLVGTYSDLTTRKAFEEELRAARIAADDANRAKSSFLAVMSHEIRTPMNGVLGMAEVLSQSELPPREADAIRTIRTSAINLLGLIDDILDFSKIEAGRLELEISDTNPAEVLEGVVSALTPVATTRHVELSLFVHPDVPTLVRSDALRMRQILYNLVGNAIKFSGGRSESLGRVRIRAEVIEGEPRALRFTVADNGIGMADATRERLFTSFMQAEASTTRRFGGTGLGLAICKRLTDMFRGTIEVRSALAEGSTFTVTLPLIPTAEETTRLLPDVAGLSCVIVRDPIEPEEADDIAAYLDRAGARVLISATPAAAIELAKGQPRPVVLVERLPEDAAPESGVAADDEIRHLRLGNGRRRVARVIAPNLVVLDRQYLRERSLLRAVAIAAGRASPETYVEQRDAPLVAPGVTAPTVAVARQRGTLILVAEDDEVNQKVIMRQLDLLGYAAEVASNGEEALRMWRTGSYGLLLTDLHMPRLDGYTLVRTVRAEELPGAHMPAIALTANALRGEETRALAIGMDAYLTKPVALALLKKTLERYLPTPEPVPEAASSLATDTPILRVEVLTALVGDDAEIVREFLIDYRTNAMRLADEVREARSIGDFTRLAAVVHKLKSSSRAVGAIRLGDLCAEIESAAKRHDDPELESLLGGFAAATTEVLAAIANIVND